MTDRDFNLTLGRGGERQLVVGQGPRRLSWVAAAFVLTLGCAANSEEPFEPRRPGRVEIGVELARHRAVCAPQPPAPSGELACRTVMPVALGSCSALRWLELLYLDPRLHHFECGDRLCIWKSCP